MRWISACEKFFWKWKYMGLKKSIKCVICLVVRGKESCNNGEPYLCLLIASNLSNNWTKDVLHDRNNVISFVLFQIVVKDWKITFHYTTTKSTLHCDTFYKTVSLKEPNLIWLYRILFKFIYQFTTYGIRVNFLSFHIQLSHSTILSDAINHVRLSINLLINP